MTQARLFPSSLGEMVPSFCRKYPVLTESVRATAGFSKGCRVSTQLLPNDSLPPLTWRRNSVMLPLRNGGSVVDMDSFFPLTLRDRKSTRLNSSHANISYAVFCLKKKQ